MPLASPLRVASWLEYSSGPRVVTSVHAHMPIDHSHRASARIRFYWPLSWTLNNLHHTDCCSILSQGTDLGKHTYLVSAIAEAGTHDARSVTNMPPIKDMRHLQTVFKGADGDYLRTGNKDGLCRQCYKKPPAGQHFRRCSGCMTTIYCSEKCQRAAWPGHK